MTRKHKRIPSALDLPFLRGQSWAVYIVAIDYTAGAGETMVRGLADALGKTLYEARLRLGAPEGGPAVVGNFAEVEPAWAFAGRLRANGIDPVLLAPEDVESDSDRFLVRSFELGEHRLEAVSRHGRTALAYREIGLVLRGTRIDARLKIQRTEERKFSPLRAVVTGGMVVTKTARRAEPVTTEQREDFLHVYADGQPPLAFHASALNYESFGPALHPSTAANFAYLVDALRQALPHTRFDDRLTNRQARARLLGPSLTENHLDIAVTLLARALRRR